MEDNAMDRTVILDKPKNIGAIIGNGPDEWQILQRQADGSAKIHLSGTWTSGEPLAVLLVKARIVLEDTGETIVPWSPAEMGNDQAWKVSMTIPEGGLYRIETCLSSEEQPAVEWSTRGDMIHHIGVGDVFVIAGQSNAAGYGKDPVSDPPEIGIHLLANDLRWHLATHPFNESTGTAHPVNRENANPGHSPWLAFAKRLRRNTGVPVGLIQTSLGGSPLSAWNPEEEGSLYRNMLEVLDTLHMDSSDRRIRGVLWYQGCSDASEEASGTYLERFSSFVSHLRADLGDPDLPFLTVQIGRYVANENPGGDIGWATVREAQRQAARILSGVVVIPALDLPLSDAIHISSAGNMVLGERAAKAVLGAFFGSGDGYLAPEPMAAVRTMGNTVKICFDYVSERLYGYELSPELSPFLVEQAGGTLLTPRSIAYSEKNEVTLVFDGDIGPGCHLHGAYRKNAYPVLPIDVSSRLPMLSFCGFQIEG